MRQSSLIIPRLARSHLVQGWQSCVARPCWPKQGRRRLSTVVARPEAQCADTLTQIGIRKVFEYEHDQYRELCRNFYEEHVVPFHDEWEKEQWSQGALEEGC